MAVSTRKIGDTINWAKRLCFNHNPVIGNSLEPALTSANIVIQTILGPPFEWWWNVNEIVFTCSTVAPSANATAISIANGVLTVTAANNFGVGALLMGESFAGITALNGLLISVDTVIGTYPNYTGFTAQVSLPNGTDTTGVFTATTTQDYQVAPPAGYNAAGGATSGWFSHIEHAAVYDITSTTPNWVELTVKDNLSLNTTSGRSTFISPESEDANGIMTFRVMPSPNKNYPISIHTQLSPPQITSINQTRPHCPITLSIFTALGSWGGCWRSMTTPEQRCITRSSRPHCSLGRTG